MPLNDKWYSGRQIKTLFAGIPGRLFLLTSFVFLFQTSAKANFDFNSNCKLAYQSILNLKITEAQAIIQREQRNDPQNGITILLASYADFFNLLASNSKTDYETQKSSLSERISKLEVNDKNSPYYLYTQAEIYLQCGISKGRFGDYFSSALDIKKASNLLKENQEKFPAFLPNKKGLALIDVIFGSLPDNLKSVAGFLGMNGNAVLGIKELENLKKELPKTQFSNLKDEVIFFLCYIDLDIRHEKNSYAKLIGYTSEMDISSLLKVYLQSYIAVKNAHNDSVIQFVLTKPSSTSYTPLPVLNYFMGNAKLNRMDKDTPIYFSKFLKETKGTLYIKDSYIKIAYFYFLSGDKNNYHAFLKQTISKGSNLAEKDKYALKEALDTPPDTSLLRARFYFDGGYYEKALKQLQAQDVRALKNPRDQLEYYYRLGRVNQMLNNKALAQSNYAKAIKDGSSSSYYYAANAALNMGLIAEEMKDNKRAISYYHLALEMRHHDYQSSIDNDAKNGLKRLND